MKTVLCYGDSLTWGYNPETGLRHDYDSRWPNVWPRRWATTWSSSPTR